MAHTYTPSTEIEAIVDVLELTPNAERTFYASQPALHNANSFNRECPRRDEVSPILGCYSSRQIHLYAIDSDDLSGIVEVTAAHELLHAEWDRMSMRERDRIGELLEAHYEATDETQLDERMAYYAEHQPGTETNELHSILGTEKHGLSPELEEHYAQYFEDRSKIVSLYNNYSETFERLEQHVQALDQRITALQSEVTAANAAYEAAVSQLNSDIAELESWFTNLDRTNVQEVNQYNNSVYAINARSAQLEADRQRINAQVDEYNTLVNEYNETALQAGDLYNQIDSHSAPTPSI